MGPTFRDIEILASKVYQMQKDESIQSLKITLLAEQIRIIIFTLKNNTPIQSEIRKNHYESRLRTIEHILEDSIISIKQQIASPKNQNMIDISFPFLTFRLYLAMHHFSDLTEIEHETLSALLDRDVMQAAEEYDTLLTNDPTEAIPAELSHLKNKIELCAKQLSALPDNKQTDNQISADFNKDLRYFGKLFTTLDLSLPNPPKAIDDHSIEHKTNTSIYRYSERLFNTPRDEAIHSTDVISYEATETDTDAEPVQEGYFRKFCTIL